MAAKKNSRPTKLQEEDAIGEMAHARVKEVSRRKRFRRDDPEDGPGTAANARVARARQEKRNASYAKRTAGDKKPFSIEENIKTVADAYKAAKKSGRK